MSLDEYEKVAEDFLREKQDAGSGNITSVKMVTAIHYEVKGDYAKKDSNGDKYKFTVTIDDSEKLIRSYEFEPLARGRRG